MYVWIGKRRASSGGKGDVLKAEDLIRPLLNHFNWMASRIIPQCTFGGGVADLLVITPASYATEIEIKVSLQDWRVDTQKEKWRRMHQRQKISRFFYAVPLELAGRVPDNLPAGAGILTVAGRAVDVLRSAKRTKATKLDSYEIHRLVDHVYFRYWQQFCKTGTRWEV